MNILIAWVINAIALYVTVILVKGITVDSTTTLFLSALVIGIINAFIKPVLKIISFPITLLTLGIFALVINAAMLGLASWLVKGFHIDSFLSAFLGAIVLSIVSTILHSLIKPKGTPSL